MSNFQGVSLWTDLYWSKFRYRSHLLIAKGYEEALSRIKAPGKRDEPAITGFIVEAIDKWLLTGPEWCDDFYVKDDHPIPGKTPSGEERQGRSRQRPDIIITYTKRPRPKYFFEAKRLRKNDSSDDYTTSKGMGCFIRGEYASEFREAAMLGYVEINTAEYWQRFLKDEIYTKETDLELIRPQSDVQIISELAFEWVSEHKRNSIGIPITIFHILLDCYQ